MTVSIGRRKFLATIGGASLARPLAARAQERARPTIGWLSSRTASADAFVLPAFHSGLGAEGFVEGRNVAIEYRWAEGLSDRLPELAADLLRQPLSAMVSVGDGAGGSRAIRARNETIPLIFVVGGDPIRLGLVTRLDRPGGPTTGVTAFHRDLGLKRLGLLHEFLPAPGLVALLANSRRDAVTAESIREIEDHGRALDKTIKLLDVANDAELAVALNKLGEQKPQALLVESDSIYFSRVEGIVAAVSRLAIPTLYFRREFVTAGGLMSYGSDTDGNYRVLGEYAGRILNGQRAGDLPVQQPTKFDLVINLKTAKALAMEIPPTLLARADEVIE